MKKKLLLFLGVLFLISFVLATSVGTSEMTKGRVVYTPPVFINYSVIATNTSNYWGSHFYTDYDLLVPYTGADKEVDLGGQDFTTTGTGTFGTITDGTLSITGGNLSTTGSILSLNKLSMGGNLGVIGTITGGGDVAIDGTTFIVDSTNNRVGVGMIPTTPFSVKGNTAESGAVVFYMYDSKGVTRSGIKDSGQQFWKLHSTATESGMIEYSTPGNKPGIVIWTGAPGSYTNRWQVVNKASYVDFYYNDDGGGTSLVLRKGGNVGIGTTSPDTKLDVEGNNLLVYFQDTSTTGAAGLLLRDAGVANRAGLIAYAENHATLASEVWLKNYFATGPLILSAGGGASEHLFIKSDGNVGIGTTSPSYPLEIRSSNVTDNNITAWFEKNISATGYITRTSVFDKSKNVWDYVKDAYYYLTNGEVDHKKFYGYAGEFEITDYSRPEEVEILTNQTIPENYTYVEMNCSFRKGEVGYYEVCEEVIMQGVRNKQLCHYEIRYNYEFNENKSYYERTEFQEKVCEDIMQEVSRIEIIYPHKKMEAGVELGAEINVLRQAIYELNERIKILESGKSG